MAIRVGELDYVQIGTQKWAIRNLDVTTFRNGDRIIYEPNQAQWEDTSPNYKPKWCYYGNNPENGKKYGLIYNRWVINDPREIAPIGWRVPSYQDWLTLFSFLDPSANVGFGDLTVSATLGDVLKSTGNTYWSGINNSTNSSGFRAVGGGTRDRDPDGGFYYLNTHAWFWGSNRTDISGNRSFYITGTSVIQQGSTQTNGLSIRLIKND